LGGGELSAIPGSLHQEGEQAIQVVSGRGHQLIRSLLVLGLLQQRGERLAWSRDQSHLRRCLETSRESLGLSSALDVILQSPECLQVLPLEKTVSTYPERFHTGLVCPFV
jgi:hypothetical protein